MKTILALDLGTKTGWAVRSPDGTMLAAGTWDLKEGRFEGGGMRFVRFVSNLKKVRASFAYDMIAFEEVRRHMGVDAAHLYGGFLAQLKVYCGEVDLPYTGIPVGTIKKFATGKGNADKEKMIAAAKAKWPAIVTTDDNTADALWIAECSASSL